jgi:hypothetical protein
MSLKPPLTEAQRAQIFELAGTAPIREIARRVGCGKTTVARILGDAPDDAPDVVAADESADDDEEIPTEIPTGTPLETIQRWKASLERWSQQAERVGNLGALSSLTARLATLLDAERRATPPPVEDPNAAPDMVAEAEAARAKVFAELESFLASKAGAP